MKKYFEGLDETHLMVLFYKILFKPKEANLIIKHLRSDDSSKLVLYAFAILGLAFLSVGSTESGLGSSITSSFNWFFSVFAIGFIAWLFRPAEAGKVDFGLLLFLCAFAQTPLIFLAVANLWNSSIVPTSLPNALIHLWSLILWVYAIYNSLQINLWKATLIAFTPILLIILSLFLCASLLINALV